MDSQPKRRWPYVVVVLIILFIVAKILSSMVSVFGGVEGDSFGGNVALRDASVQEFDDLPAAGEFVVFTWGQESL